jgi:4-hydroxy-tetrahydrodipicolinate reductase
MKIALLGYGKMGKAIERIALSRGHEIVARIGKNDDITELKKAQVVIEFTSPASAVSNIKWCLNHQLPLICGTTGWNDHLDEITNEVVRLEGSLVHASNFSLGVNLFFELNKKLAQLMQPYNEYELQLEEIHHTQKKDAPSGTAVTLAEGIVEQTNYSKWHLGEEKKSLSIPVKSVRTEDVKGTHIIEYASEIDSIEIKHTAHTRDGFALGAVIAAEWVLDKKGIFTMKEVLGI